MCDNEHHSCSHIDFLEDEEDENQDNRISFISW